MGGESGDLRVGEPSPQSRQYRKTSAPPSRNTHTHLPNGSPLSGGKLPIQLFYFHENTLPQIAIHPTGRKRTGRGGVSYEPPRHAEGSHAFQKSVKLPAVTQRSRLPSQLPKHPVIFAFRLSQPDVGSYQTGEKHPASIEGSRLSLQSNQTPPSLLYIHSRTKLGNTNW